MTAAPTTTPLWQRRLEMFRRFTTHIDDLIENSGVRADLRTAARHPWGQCRPAQRYVLAWIHSSTENTNLAGPEFVRRAMAMVAGMMAQFPHAHTLEQRWARHSNGATPPAGLRFDLGLALAELQRARPPRGDSSDPARRTPLERRLEQMCACDQERFQRYLFSLLAYLDQAQARVPAWWQLTSDIAWRTHEPERVALYWQESFLRAPEWRRDSS